MENIFSMLFDNNFIEVPGSKLKILGKASTLLTAMNIPKQGKTNMNHNA